MGVKFNSKTKFMAMILVEPGLKPRCEAYANFLVAERDPIRENTQRAEYFAEAGNFLPTTANKKSTFAQVILFIWRQLK